MCKDSELNGKGKTYNHANLKTRPIVIYTNSQPNHHQKQLRYTYLSQFKIIPLRLLKISAQQFIKYMQTKILIRVLIVTTKQLAKPLFLGLAVAVAISCNVEARLAKADRLYEEGVYYKVEKQYSRIAGSIPNSKKQMKARVYFQIAECNRKLFNMKKAENYYNRAIKSGFRDSVTYLNLAKTQMAMGNYIAASRNFGRFLQDNPTHQEALDGLISADHAKELLRQPLRYRISPAAEFNSKKSSDLSPAFVGNNGDLLMFTSNRDVSKKQKKSDVTGRLNFDLYSIKKNSANRWEKPVFAEKFNLSDDDGVCSFTADGRTMFFTRVSGENDHKQEVSIMTSTRSGGEWSEPQLLMVFKDSSINVAHPAISPDGTTLYFVSDFKAQSFGGNDIFVTTKEEGVWSIPENLGERINTTGNEMFPHIAPDGTLYFASDGHQGFGGLDIYRAKRDSNGVWQVLNMLAPINSPSDDFGITFRAEEQSGFFSSNRGNNKNLDNIYWFELPEITYFVEGTVSDENGQPLDAIIKLIGNDGSIVKQRVKRNGAYRIKLNPNVNYVMMASHRGYLNSSNRLSTIGETDSKVFETNFRLPSVSKPIKMENIFYEFGKWEITQESEIELDNLVKLLNDNPNITIELSAHTDSVGAEEANTDLSQKRANAAVEYLIKAGIAKDRLIPKGYGESRPMTVDSFLAKRYGFLKEGDVLTPEFIMSLADEYRAICNQINRRTEFRVLRTTYNLY